jgi:hypothetical protein
MNDESIKGYSYTKRQVRPDNKNNNGENRVAVSCRRFGTSVSSTDVMQGLSYVQCPGCSRKDQLNLVESLTLCLPFYVSNVPYSKMILQNLFQQLIHSGGHKQPQKTQG